ncbi:MAG: N-acetylmuramoyl-L-alanine amidase [Rhodocyclaceae bacterium]|nr:N-acetylmuramoyl-L-alanine amidase [Rhodocyclaceae bacterium]
MCEQNQGDSLGAATKSGRRGFLRAAGGLLALAVTPVAYAAATRIIAVRVWPSEDYTRITLEGADDLRFDHQLITNPDRLVVDLHGVEFDSIIRQLPESIGAADPYIKLIRAGRNRPGVVRLVVELKQAIDPQVFTLKPYAGYGHRLVLDLYPNEPLDPLLALIEKNSPAEAAAGDAASPQRGESVPVGRDPQPAKSPPPVARLITVALDPGHGGEDPGAVGRRGSYEKNVTLSIARRLKAKIDAQPGMRAVLTRDGDYFVPLYHRVRKARRVRADLFVSIHADAFIRPDARGSSVFVLSDRGATSAAARWLAKKENDADLVGGVNLSAHDGHLARTLLDLSQTAAINDSMKIGASVLTEIGDINTLHKARVEQAGFAVLKAPDIPSILVETAFISNPEEERRLNDRGYQDKMADAILRGIRKHFDAHPLPSRSKLALAD